MKRIGLVGYFGWGNFGDELFVKVHRQELSGTYDLHVVNDLLEAPYHSRPLEELVDEYDGFLIGGGDLLNPQRVSDLYWRHEYLKKPTYIYGLGVPNQPYRREAVIATYQKFLRDDNCKLVVARDIESYTWIKKNIDPGEKLTWYPDPVCAMNRPEPLPNTEKTLGVVMREHRSLNQDMAPVRRLIDEAKDMGYRVRHLVLSNMSLGASDLTRAQLIAAGTDEEIFHSEDLDELCQQISSCSALATIKFHGLIVATMYGVPSIAMSVTPKNRNFLRMIERTEMLCSYTDPNVYQRLSHYPARIPQKVRGDLYRRSRAGYEHLRKVMAETL
ncbi:polysaccharide pyruvyl transferase family protein [Aestuariimicrobium soli]|uniref:polysaccharide pyruvyl transferase family protein n=1 Tax=Aestuariimicrobium soli TaxID=2035834 RepID=UPI003EB9C551